MKILSARWERVEGFPRLALRVEYAGERRLAIVGYDQKSDILNAGYCHLHPDWEDRLPPAKATIHGQEYTLHGVTGDATILQLARTFVHALMRNEFAEKAVY